MSVGHARAAIREMVRLPRPGRVWPRWLWIVALAFPLAIVAKLVGRLWTWIGLTVGFGLALGLVPLFGVLGYELAIAASLFAAVMGLDLGSALARELQRTPAPGVARSAFAGRTLAHSTASAVLLVTGLMLIPAVISAVRGIWLPTCDWWFGIKAYLVMPIVTAMLAAAVGHTIGIIAGPRRFVGAALAQVPLIAVALAALYRFYSAPPVFTYNAVLGYFPGNLYDENVKLTATLAWSRLEQVLWVITFVAAIALRFDVPRFRFASEPRPAGRRYGSFAIAVVCAASAVVLHTQSGQLGYAIDREDIEEALGGRLETPHFIIHYSDTEDVREVIGLVAADHEFRYAQVTAQLGVQSAGKIRSFYFANRDEKERWMGARDVEMAKPWRREIYLDHRSFPHGSLRHEIAHAVAAEFGDPLFGVATQRVFGLPLLASPGLIEGLATAIDWPGRYDRMTPHESVRALQEMGKRPSITRLLSLQFFSVSSATGYTTAGSFLRFLLDTYGAPGLRAVYRNGGDFEAAYGKSLAVLEQEWLAMTSKIVLPRSAVEASRERFRGTSVFSRPCPHAIAASREHVADALGQGDRPRAITLMRDVCGDAPEEPRYRLDLAEILYGGEPRERLEAITLWTAIALDPEGVTSTLRAEALEKLARAAAARNDFVEVRRLIAEAVKLPVDADDRRQLEALSFALAYPGPAGDAIRGYFYDTDHGITPPTWALLATFAEPTLGFGHYLLGLQRYGRGDLTSAATALERALALGLPGTAFVKNAARRLAVAAYRVNDPAKVAVAISVLSGPEMTAADRLLAQDWAARLAFDAKR
ncbi:MAG: Tetratricopeptide 4 [Myxococcales bacterium]|nr:Tetratricopeptide 4 [Myxococcales bacterium]